MYTCLFLWYFKFIDCPQRCLVNGLEKMRRKKLAFQGNKEIEIDSWSTILVLNPVKWQDVHLYVTSAWSSSVYGFIECFHTFYSYKRTCFHFLKKRKENSSKTNYLISAINILENLKIEKEEISWSLCCVKSFKWTSFVINGNGKLNTFSLTIFFFFLIFGFGLL